MIVLFGATGVTGKLVANELQRAGKPVRIVGRDAKKLQEMATGTNFDVMVIDLQKPGTIQAALAKASVLINCIGPFSEHSIPIVKAAVEANLHYLDTTGEQVFIKRIFEEFGGIARSKRLCLVPACAFEYAIADTLASFAASANPEAETFDFLYRVKGGATSLGTRKSVLKQLEYSPLRLNSGKLQAIHFISFSVDPAVPIEEQRLTVEFPGGEALLLPLHTRAKDVRSYMQLSKKLPRHSFSIPAMLFRAAALFPLTGAFFAAALTKEGNPTYEELERVTCSVTCTARNTTTSAISSASARDPYGVTAVIVSQVALKLLQGNISDFGPCAPSMVAGADFIRKETEKRGVDWMIPR